MSNKINFKNRAILNYISVVIPVYKDPEGIGDTLESLKNQTLKQSAYEVIVVNDGADPETEKICKKFGVKVINQTPNQGSYSARNRGLEESKGEYIALTDADVKVPPDWLEKGINGLNLYDYYGGRAVIDLSKTKKPVHWYQFFTGFDSKSYMDRKHFVPTVNLFVKRTVFEDLGGFDKRLFSSGDLEFGNRVWGSGKYSQKLDDSLKVIHPPRDSLTKKIIRVRYGIYILISLFEDRFKDLKPNILLYIPRIVWLPYKKIFLQRLGFLMTIRVIMYAIWIRSIELYYIFNIFVLKKQYQTGGKQNG